MEYLWKRESDQIDSLYVDLIALKRQNDIVRQSENDREEPTIHKSLKDSQWSTELRLKGNVKFRSGLWTEAMSLYNQSLCCAEIDSENVALAYAHRSECFFNLKHYAEAIIDIELAEKAHVPKRLLPKLADIKLKSQNLLKSMEKSRIEPITLSYAPDENHSCMANVLKINCNQQFGRHIIATDDIPVGKTVLIEQDFLSQRCDDEPVCYTCFREKTNFIACAQCCDVVFCNIDCMNQNPTHKWECGTHFAQLHHRMKLHIRAILLAIETFSTVDALMRFVENVLHESSDPVPASLHSAKSKYHFFFKLSTSAPFAEKHFEKVVEIYENVMALRKVRVLFSGEPKRRFLMHLVMHHFCIIKTNSIMSKNPWSSISVLNVVSMLNHSCSPNIFHPRKGNHQYCVTIRPVKKGQQLFISYVPLNNELSTEERQQKFKSSWSFRCYCEKCDPVNESHSFNQTIDSDLITADPGYQFLLENFRIEGNAQQLTVLMDECISLLNKHGQTQWLMETQTVVTIFILLYVEMLLGTTF